MNIIQHIIKLDRAKFWTDNGILFCEILHTEKKRYLNTGTIEKYLNAIRELCKDEKMPFLLDLRNTEGTFSSNAAKKLAINQVYNKSIISEVFVVNSLKMRLLINSYKRIYEPSTPFKIFEDYNEALNYLITIKNTENGSN